jgi:hypothetical protein
MINKLEGIGKKLSWPGLRYLLSQNFSLGDCGESRKNQAG